MTKLSKLIEDYLKKKEFVFKDKKLYNYKNELILDGFTSANLRNIKNKTNNIEL